MKSSEGAAGIIVEVERQQRCGFLGSRELEPCFHVVRVATVVVLLFELGEGRVVVEEDIAPLCSKRHQVSGLGQHLIANNRRVHHRAGQLEVEIIGAVGLVARDEGVCDG